jgi:Leucine-rich repeat (LRR) protein
MLIKTLTKTNKRLFSIDISENVFRKKSAEAIAEYVTISPTIEILSMNKMAISDTILERMFEAIDLKLSGREAASEDPTFEHDFSIPPPIDVPVNTISKLLCLCLSGNKISDRGAEVLASSLKFMSLTALDLSWNEIMSQGVCALAGELNSSSISTLDLSWNAIGSVLDRHKTAAFHFSKMLRENKCLTHLDLSQNHLSQQECSLIGEGLRANHTLLGLHMTGNPAAIDSHGYLTPCTDLWSMDATDHLPKIISYDVPRIDMDRRNNCWICGNIF